jgi:hypothetical protein
VNGILSGVRPPRKFKGRSFRNALDRSLRLAEQVDGTIAR